MNNSIKKFLLIDDDPLNNYLTKRVIKKVFQDAEIIEFTEPEIALTHLENNYLNNIVNEKIIVFLDINMPTMSGWEFLLKFEKYNETIKNQFDIFMFSSSINPADINRAKQDPMVIDFIEKPLEIEKLIKLFV
jgi:response regulator RpfG family c-di-GMP phosphodiesterase